MPKPTYYEVKLVTHDVVFVDPEVINQMETSPLNEFTALVSLQGERVFLKHVVKITPVFEQDEETVVTAPTPNQVEAVEIKQQKETTPEDILNEAKKEAE